LARHRELRSYFDHATESTARALTGRYDIEQAEIAPTVEAARIAVALRRHASGHPAAYEPDRHDRLNGGSTLQAEIEWLTRVAVAFRHSPVVAIMTQPPDANFQRDHPRPPTYRHAVDPN